MHVGVISAEGFPFDEGASLKGLQLGYMFDHSSDPNGQTKGVRSWKKRSSKKQQV